jgi:CBS domain-containing protein
LGRIQDSRLREELARVFAPFWLRIGADTRLLIALFFTSFFPSFFPSNPKQQYTSTLASKNMKVASFMVPRSHVISCCPDDSLRTAIQKMLQHDVGSIIVMQKDKDDAMPVGIVTKTDLIRGWEKGLDADKDAVSEVMGTNIETVLDTQPSGVAAEHFEKTKHRHAFVVDKDNNFVGIVTAYDIAVETARDHKAWPYSNRDAIAEKYKVPATHTH